jgi:hypothetical protein
MGYRKPAGPCPDPRLYAWVNTKNGGYWRRRRGTVKRATLNATLTAKKNQLQLVSPAVNRIINAMDSWLVQLETGALPNKIRKLLMKDKNFDGTIRLSRLNELDWQEKFTLGKIYRGNHWLMQKEHTIMLQFESGRSKMNKLNKLVTNYFVELVLLWGDASIDGGLQTSYAISPLFSFAQTEVMENQLYLDIPDDEPWIAMIKVSCLEGNEMASHARHYGMKVVGVNRSR